MCVHMFDKNGERLPGSTPGNNEGGLIVVDICGV